MTASRMNHPPADAEWIHDMESEDQPLTTDVFGSLTFTGDVMLKRLSEDVYKKLQQTMQQGLPLDPAIANTVAEAMKDWALEHGCTHYCHWFQPQIGRASCRERV